MLGQKSCCTGPQVAGRWWSRHRHRPRFAVTRVLVTRKFRQRAVPIQFVVIFYNSFRGWCQDCVWRIFFVPHAKTSFQFFFTSVPLQRTTSYRSVVKNFQVFLPTSILFGLQVGRSTPTHRGLCFVNAQHLVCLQLCQNFVCLCMFSRFVVHA